MAPSSRHTQPALSDHGSTLKRTTSGLLILPIALGFVWCVVSMLRHPYHFPIDDSYFYLQIANNFAHGKGSTFSGVTPTNGYHPLWMLTIALVSRVSPLSKGALIYEISILQFALMLVGCVAILKIFGQSMIHAIWSLAIYEGIYLGKGTLSLMEIWLTTPLLLLSVLLLMRLDDPGSSGRRTRWLLGLTLAAATLARLETGFTSGFFWLAAVWIMRRRNRETGRPGNFWRAIVECLPAMMLTPLITLAYLITNKRAFGVALPISGTIKSSFPHPHLQLGGALGVGFLLLLLTGLAAALVQVLRRNGGWRPSAFALALAALAGGLTISLGYDILFSRPAQWYFAEGYTYILLGAPVIIVAILGHRPALNFAGILLVAASTCTLNYLRGSTNFMINPDLREQQGLLQKVGDVARNVSLELGSMLPPHAGVLIRDSPGILAYSTDLNVYPADGLVASTHYSQEVVKEGALPYFCSHGIDYVVGPEPSADQPYLGGTMDIVREGNEVIYRVRSPIGHKLAGEWVVPYAPVETFPEISPQYMKHFPTIGLRRIPCRRNPGS